MITQQAAAQHNRPEWAMSETPLTSSQYTATTNTAAAGIAPSNGGQVNLAAHYQVPETIESVVPASAKFPETTESFQAQTTLARVHQSENRILPASESTLATPGRPGISAKAVSLGSGPDFSAQLPDDEPYMAQFFDVLQWTVLVLLLAVVSVLLLKRLGRSPLASPVNSVITHLATLPVRNHFQAHLLEIAGHRFLVTTDRGGVKSVNPITSWESMEVPVSDPGHA